MRFYNREKEIEAIEKLARLAGKHAHMLVVMGRRRVGKTRLIQEAVDGHYFFVDKKSSALLLKEFSSTLGASLGAFVPEFASWGDFVRYVFEHSREKPLTVVFDEFQNFRYVDASVFSIFQKHWDAYSASSKILLIFIGSYVGLMKKIFTDEKEPLFGRITARIDVKPLRYRDVRQMCLALGIKAEEEIAKLYVVFGGVPRYYQLLEEHELKSCDEAIETLIFMENSVLRDEARQILVGELGRNYATYFSILEAISFGKSTLKEISDFTGVEMRSLGKYLGELIRDFDLVERRTPVINGEKMGRYAIKDSMTRFWFRFVYPNTSLLESGKSEQVLKKLQEEFPAYMGKAIEEVVRENIADKLPFQPEKIGSWWNRRGEEIDIVALNEKTGEILFGEIKWSEHKAGKEVLEDLLRKKELLQWQSTKRKEHLLIFSRSGYTPEARKQLAEKNVAKFELRDMAKK